jgi:hypothetical protein
METQEIGIAWQIIGHNSRTKNVLKSKMELGLLFNGL